MSWISFKILTNHRFLLYKTKLWAESLKFKNSSEIFHNRGFENIIIPRTLTWCSDGGLICTCAITVYISYRLAVYGGTLKKTYLDQSYIFKYIGVRILLNLKIYKIREIALLQISDIKCTWTIHFRVFNLSPCVQNTWTNLLTEFPSYNSINII